MDTIQYQSKSAGSEVYRLRKLFRSDIPCIELSAVPELTQSTPKLTSLTCDTNIPPNLGSAPQEQPVCSGQHKPQAISTVCILIKCKTLGCEET